MHVSSKLAYQSPSGKESILTISHLINRTPYELLFGKKPTTKNLEYLDAFVTLIANRKIRISFVIEKQSVSSSDIHMARKVGGYMILLQMSSLIVDMLLSRKRNLRVWI